MSELMVFLLILAAVLAFVGWMIWKVLKAPIAPPAEPTPLQMEPVTETRPTEVKPAEPMAVIQPVEEIVSSGLSAQSSPLSEPRSAEPVSGRTVPQSRWMPGKDSGPRTGQKAAFVAGALFLPVGIVAALGTAYLVRQRHKPRLRGGDEDLGWKAGATQGKTREVPALNIRVLASGRIEVEGREVTPAQLEAQLADLKSRRGKVRYYCEPVEPKPPQAAEVMKLLVNLDIPFTSGG